MTSVAQAQVRRWYEELGPTLLLYARSLATDASAAEDALHQVFLRLLSGEVAMPDDARPYLFRAVRNAAVNLRRAEVREMARRAEAPRFEAPAELEEARIVLEDALESLPPEQREVVVLRTWGDMTFEEVGDLLGIPSNTAASRHRYALEKLRERMAAFATE